MDLHDHPKIDLAVLSRATQPGPASDGNETFRDLIDWIQNVSGYPTSKARGHISNLRKMATVVASGVTSGNRGPMPHTKDQTHLTVPSEPEWVSAHLPPYRRAVYKFGKPAFNNMLSSYRIVQRARGKLGPERDDPLPPECQWSKHLAGLPRGVRMNLGHFARFAHANGIDPANIGDQFRDSFRTHLARHHLRPKLDKFIRTVSNAWNAAVAAGAMGPDAKPLTVQRKRARYVLRADEFNTGLQQQYEDLVRLMMGGDRRKPASRREPSKLKARSVKTYGRCILQAATALTAMGHDRKHILVSDLVDPRNFSDILEFYYRRARRTIAEQTHQCEEEMPESVGVQSQVNTIAKGLIWAAKHHIRVSSGTLEMLIDEASRYRPQTSPDVHPKVRERLDQIFEPENLSALLHLPARLDRLAYEKRLEDPMEAARLAMASLTTEIEMNCPVRFGILTRFQLKENIIFSADGRNVVALRIPIEDNKSPRLYDWPIEAQTQSEIRRVPARLPPDPIAMRGPVAVSRCEGG
jgi:hypothetical protein